MAGRRLPALSPGDRTCSLGDDAIAAGRTVGGLNHQMESRLFLTKPGLGILDSFRK
jgi:hypothetical protein